MTGAAEPRLLYEVNANQTGTGATFFWHIWDDMTIEFSDGLTWQEAAFMQLAQAMPEVSSETTACVEAIWEKLRIAQGIELPAEPEPG